jgi:hypothetical protein
MVFQATEGSKQVLRRGKIRAISQADAEFLLLLEDVHRVIAGLSAVETQLLCSPASLGDVGLRRISRTARSYPSIYFHDFALPQTPDSMGRQATILNPAIHGVCCDA